MITDNDYMMNGHGYGNGNDGLNGFGHGYGDGNGMGNGFVDRHLLALESSHGDGTSGVGGKGYQNLISSLVSITDRDKLRIFLRSK